MKAEVKKLARLSSVPFLEGTRNIESQECHTIQ